MRRGMAGKERHDADGRSMVRIVNAGKARKVADGMGVFGTVNAGAERRGQE